MGFSSILAHFLSIFTVFYCHVHIKINSHIKAHEHFHLPYRKPHIVIHGFNDDSSRLRQAEQHTDERRQRRCRNQRSVHSFKHGRHTDGALSTRE